LRTLSWYCELMKKILAASAAATAIAAAALLIPASGNAATSPSIKYVSFGAVEVAPGISGNATIDCPSGDSAITATWYQIGATDGDFSVVGNNPQVGKSVKVSVVSTGPDTDQVALGVACLVP
jgi:hypothetical protein